MKNEQRHNINSLINRSSSLKKYIFLKSENLISQKKILDFIHIEKQKKSKNGFINILNSRKPHDRMISLPPVTSVTIFIARGNNSQLIRQILLKRKNVMEVSQNDESKFRWYPNSGTFRFERLNNDILLFNHFEHHRQITNKQYLTRNLSSYCEKKRINIFDLIPPTFILNLSDLNFQAQNAKFVAFYNAFKPVQFNIHTEFNSQNKIILNIKKNIPSKISIVNIKSISYKPNPYLFTSDAYLWILKPTSLNRGRGIHLFQNLQEVEQLINQYNISKNLINQTNLNLKNKVINHSFVIQKYIQKPMLIKNRKFDLRVWVLLDHEQNLYFYKEGYARTSSQVYTRSDKGLKNEYIHLTNNAIQKKGKNYGKNQQGNQLSFAYLNQYMKQAFGKQFQFQKIVLRMKELVKIVFQCVEKKINFNKRKYCFQLFGFDFMIDESCKVWLIQVNTNPCLELSSYLLEKLIPKMLNDTFRLTFDKIFNIQRAYDLSDLNDWEKIYSLN